MAHSAVGFFLAIFLSLLPYPCVKKTKQGNTATYNKIKLLRVRKTANVSHL